MALLLLLAMLTRPSLAQPVAEVVLAEYQIHVRLIAASQGISCKPASRRGWRGEPEEDPLKQGELLGAYDPNILCKGPVGDAGGLATVKVSPTVDAGPTSDAAAAQLAYAVGLASVQKLQRDLATRAREEGGVAVKKAEAYGRILSPRFKAVVRMAWPGDPDNPIVGVDVVFIDGATLEQKAAAAALVEALVRAEPRQDISLPRPLALLGMPRIQLTLRYDAPPTTVPEGARAFAASVSDQQVSRIGVIQRMFGETTLAGPTYVELSPFEFIPGARLALPDGAALEVP